MQQHLKNGTLLSGGRYKIVRFISAGGFGCTYEAEFTTFGERVAIKEFFVKDFCNRDDNTGDVTIGITSRTALVNKLQKKFMDEATALRKLEHKHIVKVFDVFEQNHTAYYVMDFIDGMSLGEIITQRGPLPEAAAVKYTRQICSALEYVHSKKRLHLDIKPGNIMVDSNDNAKLIDFGVSKQYDEEAGENTSTLLGRTPGFAPLEQLGNDIVRFTPATDIYALGATLYKLLTGVTPPSATLLASGEKIQPLPPTISAATQKAIAAAMQTNKNQRPQTIQTFIQLLDGKTPDSEETIINNADRTAPASAQHTTAQTQPAPAYNNPNAQNNQPAPNGNSTKSIILGVILGALIVALSVTIFLLATKNKDSNSSEDKDKTEVVKDTTEQKKDTVNAEAEKAEEKTYAVVEQDAAPEPPKPKYPADANAGGTYEMHGQIGNYPIGMHLEIYGDYASGTYYYKRYGPNAKMYLSGSLSGGMLYITEANADGYQTGEFVGKLRNGVFSGTFSNFDSGKNYKFTLQATSYHP